MNSRSASKRLLAAAGLSLAAHAMLITGNWLQPPDPAPALPVLSARLEPLPPPVQQAPPAAVPRRAAPPKRVALAPRTVSPAPTVVTEMPVPFPEASEVTDATPAPPDPPVVVASTAPTTFKLPDTPPLPEFPRKGRITYLLSMGADHTPVGRTVHTWEFEGDRYRLGSQSESTGLIELFRPHRFHFLSQGTLSEQGLRPERFLASTKRGSRTEESLAIFDWDKHRAHLSRVPQQITVDLPAGTQDVISFMYQLALSPPAAGRISMPFTRGSVLETVNFDVLSEEFIETPLGRLRTVPVVQSRIQGSESIAVWLATDYRHLPVRIRFFSRDGEVSGEQLVSEIRVGDE